MKARIFPKCAAPFCACLLFLGVHSPALDLTPKTAYRYGNEGPPVEVIEVSDGLKKFSFVPPAKWLADGNPTTLRLTSGDSTQAWMKLIAVIKKDDDHIPDEQSPAEDVLKWATQYIPGANNITYIKTVPTPFMVNAHPSTEFQFTYVAYGQRALISVSVVDFNDTQRLVILVSADKNNFERVRQQAVACMFSFQPYSGK